MRRLASELAEARRRANATGVDESDSSGDSSRRRVSGGRGGLSEEGSWAATAEHRQLLNSSWQASTLLREY